MKIAKLIFMLSVFFVHFVANAAGNGYTVTLDQNGGTVNCNMPSTLYVCGDPERSLYRQLYIYQNGASCDANNYYQYTYGNTLYEPIQNFSGFNTYTNYDTTYEYCEPQKNGYRFLGYAVSGSDDLLFDYRGNQQTTNVQNFLNRIKEDKTLEARFSPIFTIKIRYGDSDIGEFYASKGYGVCEDNECTTQKTSPVSLLSQSGKIFKHAYYTVNDEKHIVIDYLGNIEESWRQGVFDFNSLTENSTVNLTAEFVYKITLKDDKNNQQTTVYLNEDGKFYSSLDQEIPSLRIDLPGFDGWAGDGYVLYGDTLKRVNMLGLFISNAQRPVTGEETWTAIWRCSGIVYGDLCVLNYEYVNTNSGSVYKTTCPGYSGNSYNYNSLYYFSREENDDVVGIDNCKLKYGGDRVLCDMSKTKIIYKYDMNNSGYVRQPNYIVTTKSTSFAKSDVPSAYNLTDDYCVQCENGKYYINGECRTCNAGYCESGNSCDLCPAGYMCPESEGNLSCADLTVGYTYICPKNTYSEIGSTECTACPFGTTKDQNEDFCFEIQDNYGIGCRNRNACKISRSMCINKFQPDEKCFSFGKTITIMTIDDTFVTVGN